MGHRPSCVPVVSKIHKIQARGCVAMKALEPGCSACDDPELHLNQTTTSSERAPRCVAGAHRARRHAAFAHAAIQPTPVDSESEQRGRRVGRAESRCGSEHEHVWRRRPHRPERKAAYSGGDPAVGRGAQRNDDAAGPQHRSGCVACTRGVPAALFAQ
eukprot:6397426-Prymnesium_polylepis.4